MNVKTWLKQAKHSDASIILATVLGVTEPTWLIIHEDQILTESKKQQADEMLARRLSGEPLAYILGYREFYGRNFKVTPDVLIPRPETEEIIDLTLETVKKERKIAKILDIGTGSGCIAITLALELEKMTESHSFEVLGVDISEKALKIARENAEILGAEKVFFQLSDLTKAVKTVDFDVIIANLPYVDRNWAWIGKSLKYEPELALFAEKEGLELINRLILQLSEQKPNKKQYLLLEADPCQHEKIVKTAKSANFELIEIRGFILSFIR